MELSKLIKEFPEADLEWRIGRCGETNGKIWAMCFAYVTNRAIMERLDDVCGAGKWKNEFEPWVVGDKYGVRCGISIKVGDEWVTKYDGANPTDMEPIKGGFSDSMKRAAVQWGIGRHLYNLDEGFATIVQKGAKGARYAQTKEKKAFYWIPPSIGGGKVEAPEEVEAPVEVVGATSDLLLEIQNLAKETGTDMDQLKAHYKITGHAWPLEQATKAIASLKKKLADQNDNPSK